MADIETFIQAKIRRAEAQILTELKALGARCINEARLSKQYQNWSYNLISSTGYVITYNGKTVHSDFEQQGGGSKGMAEGIAFAEKIARGYRGYALVIVAGMDYALYVESSGKNVLHTSSKLLDSLFPASIERIRKAVA